MLYSVLHWCCHSYEHYILHRINKRRQGTVKLTWVAFAKDFDGSGHFLLTDAFVLLPLGGCFEALPGQRTQVEVHEDVAQRLQVVPSGLFCRHRGDKVRSAARRGQSTHNVAVDWTYRCPDVCLLRRSGQCRSGSCSRGRGCAGVCGRRGISWPGRSR